jgi:hypothetical protein
MRIGERLVQERTITVQQLEEALRQQVMQGGRVGTNLVELGYLKLDDLAGALARQHNMPAAMRSHFENANPDIQRLVPPDMAALWSAVPLGVVAQNPIQVAVAVADPMPPTGIDQLSVAIGERVVACIAGELRVFYYLEQIYGIPRSNRFMRVRPTPTGGVRALPDPDPQRGEDDLAEPPVESGRERRRFVKTLSDVAVDIEFDDDDPEVTEEKKALGRIALKRVGEDGRPQILGEKAVEVPPRDLKDTLKAIRRATGRDKVGDLVLDALDEGFHGYFNVGAILVIREPVAIGWKGFVRGRDPEIVESIALPLTAQSCVLQPYLTGEPFIGPPPGGGTPLDQRLWSALGVHEPGTVAALPVSVDGHLVCMVYAQSMTPINDAAVIDEIHKLARSMKNAFGRLIRAAQR